MKRSHVPQLRPDTAEKTKILTDLTFLRSTLTGTKLTVLNYDSGALIPPSQNLLLASVPVWDSASKRWRVAFMVDVLHTAVLWCHQKPSFQALFTPQHRGLPEEGWPGQYLSSVLPRLKTTTRMSNCVLVLKDIVFYLPYFKRLQA